MSARLGLKQSGGSSHFLYTTKALFLLAVGLGDFSDLLALLVLVLDRILSFGPWRELVGLWCVEHCLFCWVPPHRMSASERSGWRNELVHTGALTFRCCNQD